jgi:hypothetical protein
MTLRPITEEEKQALEIGRMMRQIANDPKTRADTYKLVKKAHPQARWLDQELEDFKANFTKEQEDKAIKAEAAKRVAEQADERERLLKRVGEPTLKKIETLMEQHGIYSYEIGAKLYQADNPPTQNGNGNSYPDSSRWSMPSDEKLLKDPSAWANEMAHRVIGEFRNRTLPR